MRILHVINDLETGGAQRLIADMIPLIQAHGHTAEILVLRDFESELSDLIRRQGVKIHSLHAKNLKDPRLIFGIRRFARNFDVVHVHLFPALYLAALAKTGTKPYYFYTEHSTSNKRRGKWYFRPIERFIYKHYDRIISISPQTKASLLEWIGSKYAERHVVIENGVDLSRFETCSSRRQPKYTRLVMVARFVEAKNHEMLIRAMAYLPARYTLTFVGDGPTRQTCQALANRLGLDERITFLGTRADIPDILCEADLGVHCSHWEGFGLTAVEIMASGLPIIVTDTEGLRQVVEDAGIVVPSHDAHHLAQTIQNILTNEDLYKKTAEKCKKRALKYNNHTMVSRYIKEYHEQLALEK